MKIAVINHLKKNVHSDKSKALSLFYTELCELEKSLITNINLGLIFSALVSRASEILSNKN